MSLTIDDFETFFGEFYRDAAGQPLSPFPWQSRLARQVFNDGWPDCIDLPTASGKTACIDIAVFVLACQASLPPDQRTAGRRIFFTVNRRVIVDEAFDRADKLACQLMKAEERKDTGILGEVARALRSLNEERDVHKAPPLDRVQLRGGIYRDTPWARSLTQPMVVCTTADQLGSRLLFRGYGVSDSMKPVHAALCACDSLVLLDEAHVTRAFSQTMQLMPQYQRLHATIRPLTFVQMTATPAGEVKSSFTLNDEDRRNETLARRRSAPKPATLVKLDKKKPIVDELARRAVESLSDSRQAIGVIVNRVQTARDVEAKLRATLPGRKIDANVHLVIGRMRPLDRDELQMSLRTVVGPDRPEHLDRPVFVVATQCLEVGADYDFDALFVECASLDALRQRFGRLNRRGRRGPDGSPLTVAAAVVTNDEAIKGDDPIYGDALKHTWDWLWSNKGDAGHVDFGIAAFDPLWREIQSQSQTYLAPGCPKPLLAPGPNAAVLLPVHLDALCQTAPHPVPSPDVSYFIHGPRRDNAEVNVCWRADLGDDPERWPEIIRLLPPTSPECMTVPLRDVRRWINGDPTLDRDADMPVAETESDSISSNGHARQVEHRHVVIWRGSTEVWTAGAPRDIGPGDTLVMPVETRSWQFFGHIPGGQQRDYPPETDERFAVRCQGLDRSIDIAERATLRVRRRVVLRIHRAFPDHESFRGLSDPEVREKLIDQQRIPKEWGRSPVARVESHDYPGATDDGTGTGRDRVIVLSRILDPEDKLQLPPIDQEDEDDNMSEQDRFVPLTTHTHHVVDRLSLALGKLHLNELLAVTLTSSARLHDLGKADVRFQAMLAGVTPAEAMMQPTLLGKGDGQQRTRSERDAIYRRAACAPQFRHEMLSVQIVEHRYDDCVGDAPADRELIFHVIAAHHGRARPFAPVCVDEPLDRTDAEAQAFLDRRSILLKPSAFWPEIEITGKDRQRAVENPPAHRLDSGIAERFWALTRRHGWWGLAYLESILRLADQQASEAEQKNQSEGK
jgi:CRISPR-associated endonuclease/helicase Cas3